ncbi:MULTISPECIES: imelysin family protein [Vibrio]|uniref:Iron-regulated protein A n=1 Tax=Vibrio algicola TaxID=2662262 RepID=A0A5Q0TCL8_9VIBR|nr:MULTISPECIES: imelysin family protein [Vibrio]MBD1577582.1 imelysin family protein [Vibrio sp. S11_S32]
MLKRIIIAVCACLVGGGLYYAYLSDTTGNIKTQQIASSKPKNSQQQVHQLELEFAQGFSTSSAKLQTAVAQYCQSNNGLSLEALQEQWLEMMQAWMPLQGQAKGPAKAVALSWNVQFWPDKKNITGQKMQQLLQQKALWNTESIANQSVTVQGVTGLEWLLFDAQSPLISGDKFSCGLLRATTDTLHNHAQTITTQWQSNPWSGYDDSQWQAEYIGLLTNQLDFLMLKMSRPLAKIGHPRPYFSEAWRSKQSLALMTSNLQALRQLYLAKGLGLDAQLRAQDHSELADRLLAQFDQTISTWPKQASLFEMLQTKEGYRQALTQFNKLERIKYLLHDEVAVELGVVVGFNSTDGD